MSKFELDALATRSAEYNQLTLRDRSQKEFLEFCYSAALVTFWIVIVYGMCCYFNYNFPQIGGVGT